MSYDQRIGFHGSSPESGQSTSRSARDRGLRSKSATRINLGLLSVREFAPAHLVISVAPDFDVLGIRRNFFAAFFAIADIATINDRLHPYLALRVFFKPALNLLRRRFQE